MSDASMSWETIVDYYRLYPKDRRQTDFMQPMVKCKGKYS